MVSSMCPGGLMVHGAEAADGHDHLQARRESKQRSGHEGSPAGGGKG